MIRLLMITIALPLLAGSAAANNLSKVYINEVLYDPAGPDSSNQKMELINYGTSTVVLTNWSICIQFNYKRFPSGASIPPGGLYVIHLNKVGTNTPRDFFTGPYVNLDKASEGVSLFHTFSGFGTPANMEDFVQWGAGGQPRENVAVAAGLWAAGTFVAPGAEGQSIAYNNRTVAPPNVLPHPISDYAYEAPTLGMTNSHSIVGDVVLNEIVADPPGPNAGATTVEVYNGRAFSLNLTGWHWRMAGASGDFGLNQTVPAGGYLLVHLNATGTNDNANLYAGAGAPDLDPAAGSFALWKNSVDFANPDNLVDFVQWGAAGQAGEAEAVLASEWSAGDFIPQLAEGHSHGYTGSGNSSAAWCDQAPPTPLAATVCVPPPTDCDCAGVRISEVLADPAGPETGATRVELVNTAGSQADLLGLTFCVRGSYYSIPASVPVPAGGLVVVHLNESGSDSPADVYTGPAIPDLQPAADSFCLYRNDADFNEPANMLDFIQWGAAGQPQEPVAASAGLWTAGEFFPRVLEGASIQWRGSGNGDDPEDFCADSPTLGASNLCSTSGVPDAGQPAPGLRQNFPNPFSPRTTIAFTLERAEERVTVTIFNIAGSPVRRLLNGPSPAGHVALEWDGRDDSGQLLPNGVYVYALRTGDRTTTRKLTIYR